MKEGQANTVCIGLDGGGTSTRLLAEDRDGRHWTDDDGTSNPRIVGTKRAAKVITGLVGRAAAQFPGAEEFKVCAGIAGAAGRKMQQRLSDALKRDSRDQNGFSIEITDDAAIAYEAAFAGAPGVLFVVGTGSNVLVRTTDGTFVRSGGWGYLLGDEGSGYSIGRAGMRAVAASIDTNTETALTRRAAADLGVLTRETLIERVYGADYSPASFAPAVLEEAQNGDQESLDIVADETMMLSNRLFALVELKDLAVAGIVKTTGGLSRSRPYMLSLTRSIQSRLPTWEVVRSGREPVEGALWMAKQMVH